MEKVRAYVTKEGTVITKENFTEEFNGHFFANIVLLAIGAAIIWGFIWLGGLVWNGMNPPGPTPQDQTQSQIQALQAADDNLTQRVLMMSCEQKSGVFTQATTTQGILGIVSVPECTVGKEDYFPAWDGVTWIHDEQDSF